MDPLLALAVAASLAGFVLMGVDKGLAARGRRRVPEWWIVLGATPLGLPGLVAGALVFRHKTRKASFWAKAAVPALAAAAVLLALR